MKTRLFILVLLSFLSIDCFSQQLKIPHDISNIVGLWRAQSGDYTYELRIRKETFLNVLPKRTFESEGLAAELAYKKNGVTVKSMSRNSAFPEMEGNSSEPNIAYFLFPAPPPNGVSGYVTFTLDDKNQDIAYWELSPMQESGWVRHSMGNREKITDFDIPLNLTFNKVK